MVFPSCFVSKPEILHSSQLRTCHFLGVLICFTTCGNWSSWQEMAEGSIARFFQHRRYSQTHYWCFAAGQWHKEMLVCKHHGNSRKHMLSCKKISLFGRCFGCISMIPDVMFVPNVMKWHDQFFGVFFCILGHPLRPTIRVGAPFARWCLDTRSHTGQRAIIYSRLHGFSGFCNYKTELSICNVIPATQTGCKLLHVGGFCSWKNPLVCLKLWSCAGASTTHLGCSHDAKEIKEAYSYEYLAIEILSGI